MASGVDSQVLYSAEQIRVPQNLPMILKRWTKEAIVRNPPDLISFSAEFFATLAKEDGEVKVSTSKEVRWCMCTSRAKLG